MAYIVIQTDRQGNQTELVFSTYIRAMQYAQVTIGAEVIGGGTDEPESRMRPCHPEERETTLEPIDSWVG